MNAMALNLEAVLPGEPFAAATRRVNEWRGRCIDAFTRAEAAATECLVTMAEVEERGTQVAQPHLLGQRLEALASAIALGGPFGNEGLSARPTLERRREHAAFRNMLCHGVAKVTLDRQGRWTVVLRLVTLRSARADRETLAPTETEAEAVRASVIRASQALCSQLGQLRALLR